MADKKQVAPVRPPSKDSIRPSNESPISGGGERLIQPKQNLMDGLDRLTGRDRLYDKQAADAIANRKEAEKEGQKYAKGGMTASSRADGIAQRGKTRGKMV